MESEAPKKKVLEIENNMISISKSILHLMHKLTTSLCLMQKKMLGKGGKNKRTIRKFLCSSLMIGAMHLLSH